MLNNFPDVLTVHELKEVLRIGQRAVYSLLAAGDIRSRKVGKKYYIPKVCVIDYLNATRGTDAAATDIHSYREEEDVA